jgi:hypothetical protein
VLALGAIVVLIGVFIVWIIAKYPIHNQDNPHPTSPLRADDAT